MSEIKVKWLADLTLEGEAQHNSIYFDSRHKNHAELNGSSPTSVFLLSIVSCSTMSSIAMLTKKRVQFKGVEAFIDADTESNKINPYHFTKFRIKYHFQGVAKEDEDHLIQAVGISHKTYCPMIFMASKIAPVQYEIMSDENSIYKSENWKEKNIPICESEICEKYYSY